MQSKNFKIDSPTLKTCQADMVPVTELPTGFSNARLPRLALVQGRELFRLAKPIVELHDEGTIRLESGIEQHEFVASFAYDLTAAFKADFARALASNHPEVMAGGGNRLFQRLLLTSPPQTEVEVLINGGANQLQSWRIVGGARSTTSKEEALSAVRDIRRGIRMVLAGEQTLAFTACQQTTSLSSKRNLLLHTPVLPYAVELHVPAQTDLGFRPLKQSSMPFGKVIRLAVPLALPQSFQSLAEAVTLSPDPVTVKTCFHPVMLTSEDSTQITELLDWMRRNPKSMKVVMGPTRYSPAAASHLEAVLEAWSKSPSGFKISCSLESETAPSSSLLQMLGSDLYAGPANISGNKSEGASAGNILDLSCCLPATKQFPAVFPSPGLLMGAKIKRLFNRRTPRLPDDGVVLGRLAGTDMETVHLDERLRDRHLFLLGATGTGKSTLLFNLLLQDIQNGKGVALVDPHGDLHDAIVDVIPRSRTKDVVLIDPSQKAVPGINLLDYRGPNRSLQINFAINELLRTFERLYDMRAVAGPVFEAYFRNAILLLLENDLPSPATLTEFPLVFTDVEFRKFLKARCTNPLVVDFWSNQAERSTGDAALHNMAPYIASKLNTFIYNSSIRPIIGQASTIDFRRIMDKRGILLIKVAKGSLGPLDAQFLGSLILSKLFTVALGRANLAMNRRTPFTLYVDEFQNFANATVCDMMAESRKYGLRMVFANQTLGQLSEAPGRPNVAQAVLGNAAHLVFYRMGPEDAKKLQLFSAPEFSAEDLQALPNFHAVGRLLTAEGPTRPFVFQSLPQTSTDGHLCAKHSTLRESQRLYTRPAWRVEKEIRARRAAHKSQDKQNRK